MKIPMLTSDIDIYRAYIEDENISYCFYFTYDPSSDEVIIKTEGLLGYKIHIFDIFPEINNEQIKIAEPLSVMTKSKIEMFLAQSTVVSFFDTFRILFGKKYEK